MTPALTAALGRWYHAGVKNEAEVDALAKSIAKDGLQAEAEAERQRLERLAAHSGGMLKSRDFIGAIHLDGLRQALATIS